MPTRQGGILLKKSMTCLRRNWRVMTTLPALSTPCTWNTFLARSTPMVLTCMWTTPSGDSLFNDHPLAHSMPGAGVVHHIIRVLDRVCSRAKLADVTPHTLRHTFASVAGDLGFSELTIAGLLGHAARGVTQGYVHLDSALVVAADRVSERIAELLDGAASGTQRKKG